MVPHTQPRVSTFLYITLRPAESEDEEIAQSLLGALEIVLRIHRAEDTVPGNLPIERPHEASKPILTDERIHFLVVDHFHPAR
jgi:hypothetical protein